MDKKIAINIKLVTSVELDGMVVRAWFSDVDYVNKNYDTEKDAEEAYEQLAKVLMMQQQLQVIEVF